MTGRTVTDVPSESPDVIELIRRAALASRENLPEVRDSVDQKTLSALGMTDIAADPELSAAMARANHSNLTRWIDANIAYPGEPVPANTSRELLDHFRNAVRRGLDSTGMDAFRTGQNAAWRWWMAAVFAQAEDLEQARAALEITSASISDFVDRTMRAVWDRIQAERDDLLHSSQAEKRELVELILAGQAASRPRLRPARRHRTPDRQRVGCDPDLTVVPSAGSLWVWVDAEAGSYPAAQLPHGLQVAVGSHGRGLAGFRRSHLDAVTVQQLLARLDSPTRIATIEQVALVNLVTKDPIAAAEFTRRTLGQLAAADQGLREVLRVHLHGGCRTTHTAQTLHLHRNTVVRQLAKAERLLPAPLEDGGVAVAVALDMLHWQR